jgi:hypothetical protein
VQGAREQRDTTCEDSYSGDDQEELAEPDGDQDTDEDKAHAGECGGALAHSRVRRVALEALPRRQVTRLTHSESFRHTGAASLPHRLAATTVKVWGRSVDI